jgi:peptidoglycan/LPS O-acetylase OafA/YrhL
LLLFLLSKIGYWNAEGMALNWHFFEAILWSLFIITILFLPIKIKPLFSNVVLEKIGMISYSIFLIHYPVLYYGNIVLSNIVSCFRWSNPPPIILLISLFIITIILSSITYRFIEKPFLLLKIKYK